MTTPINSLLNHHFSITAHFAHQREFPVWAPVLKRSFPMLKGSFSKTGIVSSVAKSDEISKITHLAFSHEIMGADLLEKLSFITLRVPCVAENSL